MRKLLVVLLILGALAAGADYALKQVAEGGVATEMASALELPEAPDVTIEGWPFTPRFLAGEVPAIDVTAERAEAREVVLHDVALRITDVSFETGDVVRGRVDQVRTGGGQGSAVLRGSEVARTLEQLGADVDVSFSSGQVEIASELGSVSAEVSLDGGSLVVSAGDLLSASVNLPGLGGKVRYDSLRIMGGDIRIGLILEPGRITRG
ncbi:MAG: LmeA family phospholipid-binding protein [Actinomycetota bacterium]